MAGRDVGQQQADPMSGEGGESGACDGHQFGLRGTVQHQPEGRGDAVQLRSNPEIAKKQMAARC